METKPNTLDLSRYSNFLAYTFHSYQVESTAKLTVSNLSMASTVVLHPGREKSLLRHHPWVFEGAISQVKGKARIGDTVDVVSDKGKWLGRGAYSPNSQIRVRIWSFNQSDVIDNGFFLRQIELAYQSRSHVIESARTNACRIVAAESDGLPGITIDKYDNLLVCQLLSAGAEKHRNKIVWALGKLFPDMQVLERSDVAVREKEGLEQKVQTLAGDIPDEVVIEENGVKILVNPYEGHKTGFYLDQRDNRQVAAKYSHGKRVLNCFCYTGTFGSYALNAGAAHVTNIDVSDNALATAKRNVEINGLDSSKADFVNKDVFSALREYKDLGQQFDQIILDPPKFVDSKASLNRASRGYKDINRVAFHLLPPGGILCTFSCSGLMPADLFQKIVADAALDAGKRVQIVERMSQAPDHPVSLNYPEGYYLKGLVCRVLN